MAFIDVFLPWLAMRAAGHSGSEGVSDLAFMGFPTKLRRGRRMKCAWFPLQPMEICKYGWHEPIYIEYKGAVRAARIKRVEAYLHIDGSLGGISYRKVYFIQLAGVNKELNFECVPDFAETAEDFAKGDLHKYGDIVDAEKYTTELILKDCFGSCATVERYDLTTTNSFWRAIRWKWDGIKPEPYYVKAKNLITYDGEHFYMEIDKNEPNTWPDEASCREDNQPPIIEFN